MKTVEFVVTVMILRLPMIETARISLAGNLDPFGVAESPSPTVNELPSNETHQKVNLPSLDLIDDHRHQSLESSETIANHTQVEQAGPSLDLVDSHPHSHDDDHASIIDSAKRSLIQPSIDFLDAQLHGGEEHVHLHRNQADKEAADLNDFQQWLEEQNQTNQLSRFLLLQKEINRFHLDNTKDLTEKLNRTIEQLKSAKERSKYDL